MTSIQYKRKSNQWQQIIYLLATGLSAPLCLAEQKIHLEGVLGTSFELTIYGIEEKHALAAVNTM